MTTTRKSEPSVRKVGGARSTKSKTERTQPRPRKSTSRTSPGETSPKPARSNGKSHVWTLRLYVTGRGERSQRALTNLRKLCEQNMPQGSYEIEVIDLLKNPALAKADQILAIPTLVRKLPEPMKRIIGDLSDADRALLSLDLPKQK